MKGLFSGWAAADGQKERSSGGARREPGITRSLLALNPGQVSNTINYWEIYGPSHFHHLLSPLQLQLTWTVNYHSPRPRFAAVWSHQWDPPLSRSKSEGIPSLCVPNPKTIATQSCGACSCMPMWTRSLANIDLNTHKCTQMFVYGIYNPPELYITGNR